MSLATSLTDTAAARQRDIQRGITALLLRDMRKLRRIIIPSRLRATVPEWITAVQALVGQYGNMSASAAADFYDAERVAAQVTGRFTVPLLDLPPDEQVNNSLRWATKDLWPRDPNDPKTTAVQKAPIEQRLDAAETKAEQAAQKLVTDQGRGTIQNAVQRDRQAVAWARSAALGACAFCKLLATRGVVYKKDTVDFRAHDNCVPAGTLVDGPTAEVGYRRWYEGEMVVVSTAAGHELSITPNHPVLTDRGWVPASLLSPGDCVLSSLNAQGSLLQVPDEEHVPSRIEDVWGALSVLGLVSVPVAAEDFHGDGTDGEVDVVRADGLLWDDDEALAAQVRAEVELTLACVREGLFALLGSPEEFFGGDVAAASSVVGSLCEAQTFLLAQLGHPVPLSGATASDGRLRLPEDAPDHQAADLVALGEREFALALQVGGDDCGLGQIGLRGPRRYAAFSEFAREHGRGYSAELVDFAAGLPAEVQLDCSVEVSGSGPVDAKRFDPPGLYGSMDGPDAYARLGRDLSERLSGRVERDRVVEVRRTEFAGHVYNLQTSRGWYRADGIVVSNCHCMAIPVFKGQRFELSPHAAEWERLYRQYAAPYSGDQLNRFRKALAEHG
jgi:hypothetical protein